jgi:hypothetical protein
MSIKTNKIIIIIKIDPIIKLRFIDEVLNDCSPSSLSSIIDWLSSEEEAVLKTRNCGEENPKSFFALNSIL